jgi:large subunit ribosomal protein L24
MSNSMRIKKGDKVLVIAGKDKGKTGTVLRGIPAKRRVLVEGCGMVKKSMRPTQQNPQGGIITRESPLQVSNVQLVCPECGKPTRVSVRRVNGKAIRVCKKCGADIDK